MFAMLWTSSGGIGVIERCLSRILGRPRHNIFIGAFATSGWARSWPSRSILASLSISIVTNFSYDLRRGAASRAR